MDGAPTSLKAALDSIEYTVERKIFSPIADIKGATLLGSFNVPTDVTATVRSVLGNGSQFMHAYHKKLDDTSINVPNWSTASDLSGTRSFTCKTATPFGMTPFLEGQRYSFYTEGGVLKAFYTGSAQCPKASYGDCFRVETLALFAPNANGCKISFYGFLKWERKPAFIKGIIQSSVASSLPKSFAAFRDVAVSVCKKAFEEAKTVPKPSPQITPKADPIIEPTATEANPPIAVDVPAPLPATPPPSEVLAASPKNVDSVPQALQNDRENPENLENSENLENLEEPMSDSAASPSEAASSPRALLASSGVTTEHLAVGGAVVLMVVLCGLCIWTSRAVVLAQAGMEHAAKTSPDALFFSSVSEMVARRPALLGLKAALSSENAGGLGAMSHAEKTDLRKRLHEVRLAVSAYSGIGVAAGGYGEVERGGSSGATWLAPETKSVLEALQRRQRVDDKQLDIVQEALLSQVEATEREQHAVLLKLRAILVVAVVSLGCAVHYMLGEIM